MNLFDDQFYSTKVSKKDEWGNSGLRAWLYGRNGTVLLMLVCFLTGVFVTWLAVSSISKGEQAVEVSQPVVVVESSKQMNHEQWVEAARVEAVRKVSPTVVSIISQTKDGRRGNMVDTGLGSGIIFKQEKGKALIVTNDHVVQQAKEIEIVMYDGTRKKAKLIGSDTLADLAVLETDAEGIEIYAEFGDSDRLQVGETAIAIGNPLGLGYSHTTTVGVISAPRRLIDVSVTGTNEWKMEVIQTDAAINRGNSGGALANLEGKVIGINSLKVLDMGVEGLGFAIPINDAKPIIADLILYGKVKRPYIGIYTANVDELVNTEELKLPKDVHTGIIVLEPLGPARKAGLKTNDVIVELDGRPVHNTYELRNYLYTYKQIGDDVIVTFYRDGKLQDLTVHLTEME